METEQRTKVWIDRFQTRLTLRVCQYLLVFPVVLLNLLFAWRLWNEGAGHPGEQFVRMLRDYLPVLICLWALIPVMAWDALHLSHRLVGPIVRFRRIVQDVARGELVRPLKLRDGDYLTEFRDEINQMLEALQRRGVSVLRPTNPLQEDPVPQENPGQRTSA